MAPIVGYLIAGILVGPYSPGFEAGHHTLVGAAILSIAINPWLFKRLLGLEKVIERYPLVNDWFQRRSAARGQLASVNEACIQTTDAASPVIGPVRPATASSGEGPRSPRRRRASARWD